MPKIWLLKVAFFPPIKVSLRWFFHYIIKFLLLIYFIFIEMIQKGITATFPRNLKFLKWFTNMFRHLAKLLLIVPLSSFFLLVLFMIFFKSRLERATGIEPVSLAWKAKVLPLHNARSLIILRGHYNKKCSIVKS